MTKRLGIIQSRGLGDIVIALPIAHHYYQQGQEIHWPIVKTWVEQMRAVAPWVNWYPVEPDSGSFFYNQPEAILRLQGVDDILCLYNSLTGHPELWQNPYFQHTSFDRFKYAHAGVAFKKKWQLAECLQRNRAREEALYQSLGLEGKKYVVTHLSSSEQTVRLPKDLIPPEYHNQPITDQGWIFDWLTVIERAEALVATDSIVANLVDQLGIDVERYFIPQHHIQLTPVFQEHWHWLENLDLKPQARIFKGQ